MNKLIIIATILTLQSCAHESVPCPAPIICEKPKEAEDFVTHSCEHIKGDLYECKEIVK